MKHPIPFVFGVAATLAVIVPAHFVMNREAKLRCLESGQHHRIVQGRSFLGDTTLCVHYGEITTPFVSLR